MVNRSWCPIKMRVALLALILELWRKERARRQLSFWWKTHFDRILRYLCSTNPYPHKKNYLQWNILWSFIAGFTVSESILHSFTMTVLWWTLDCKFRRRVDKKTLGVKKLYKKASDLGFSIRLYINIPSNLFPRKQHQLSAAIVFLLNVKLRGCQLRKDVSYLQCRFSS